MFVFKAEKEKYETKKEEKALRNLVGAKDTIVRFLINYEGIKLNKWE